jgi:hypothetical protein
LLVTKRRASSDAQDGIEHRTRGLLAFAAPVLRMYVTVDQSAEVAAAMHPVDDDADVDDDDDDDDLHAFLSFIPLLRFQTDKLFGVVALPVFYAVAGALLLMNGLTVVLPWFGVPLVTGGSLNHAMAGTWQTVLFTALNLVIISWHRRLQKRVQTLVPESLTAKLRRRCCGSVSALGSPDPPGGSDQPTLHGAGGQRTASLEQAAGKLRRVGSLSPDRLARSLSLASSVDVKPAADVYISHGAEPHDLRAAQNLKKSLASHATSCISEDMKSDSDREAATEAWLTESHIGEAMAASKTFVALISEASLSSMASAHEEWSLTIAEWDAALELYNKGAVTIVPAWVGDVGLVGKHNFSEQPPKGGKPVVQGEELFDSRSLRLQQRSVKAIVEEMLRLAENSLRLLSTSSSMGADGDQPKSLMLSYRITETGDPADTKDKARQGDNFTVRQRAKLV